MNVVLLHTEIILAIFRIRAATIGQINLNHSCSSRRAQQDWYPQFLLLSTMYTVNHSAGKPKGSDPLDTAYIQPGKQDSYNEETTELVGRHGISMLWFSQATGF